MSSKQKRVPLFTTGGPGIASKKVTHFNGPAYSAWTGKKIDGGVPYMGTYHDGPAPGKFHGGILIAHPSDPSQQIAMIHRQFAHFPPN